MNNICEIEMRDVVGILISLAHNARAGVGLKLIDDPDRTAARYPPKPRAVLALMPRRAARRPRPRLARSLRSFPGGDQRAAQPLGQSSSIF